MNNLKLILLILLIFSCIGCGTSSKLIRKNKITLEWSWEGDKTKLDGFNVYRKILGHEKDFVKVNSTPVKEKEYTDQLPDNNSKTVCYKVTAIGNCGSEKCESDPSETKCTDLLVDK